MSILDVFKKKEQEEPMENTIPYRAYYSGTRLKTRDSIEHIEDVVEFHYPNTMSYEEVGENAKRWIESHGIVLKDFVVKRLD